MPNSALARAARLQQLRLRALTLRQLLSLWPIWKAEDPDTFGLFVAALLPVLRGRHRDSATLAAASYRAMRLDDGVPGRPPVQIAEFDEPQAVTALYVTGQALTDKHLLAGATLQQARETALVRVTGAASRLVLEGGRETLRLTGQADPRQTGWRRVTSASPCDWCASQASAADQGRDAAAFGGHDHCGCSPAASFR